jgi:hypothetical protein
MNLPPFLLGVACLWAGIRMLLAPFREAGNEIRGASELTPRRRPRAMSPAVTAAQASLSECRIAAAGELQHEGRPGLRRIGGGDHVE